MRINTNNKVISNGDTCLLAGGTRPGPFTPMQQFKTQVETSFQAVEFLRDSWDRVVENCGGSIYMSFDWASTWWEFYGSGKDLRIFLFFAEEHLIGILPIYIDCVGIRPVSLSIARLVGANIPPKAFNPPVPLEIAEQAFRTVANHLFQEERCDILSYGPVSEEHSAAPILEQVARACPGVVDQVTIREEGVQSVFLLPKSQEEFFERMDKDERKKRKYELRVLRREPSVVEDILKDPSVLEAELENFARMHAGQWKLRGKLGHFGSWPAGLEYNRALVRRLGRVGRVRFVRIRAGDEVISSQFAFVFGNSYFWELPARVINSKWQRFSLGPAGFFALVDAAIKEGKTRVEGGLAHYDYKQKLGAREHQTRVFRLVGRRLASRFLTRLFLGLRFVLLWGYYKLWYSRISPRLPAPLRKPIWRFWLRLDF